MKLEPIEQVAIELHSNPGAYALLMGSGVSRGAGVPTGWEITLDLVKHVAVAKLHGQEPQNPHAWYVGEFGKEPDYSEVLDALGKTQAERNRLLRKYFEPSEQEREQRIKIPGDAHRAIASLVGSGHIRLIITTNFDRLAEQALEAEGVAPQVISTDDALKGALPYVHEPCTILKLHGDYKDTRIKNTPQELAAYSKPINQLLDRILDEFGLIVCGWSAVWDTALRNAIYRCPSRRFTTFWAYREMDEKAKELVAHRRAVPIPIESANQFFSDLRHRVEALDRSRQPHPSSVEQAVGLVKLYLPEPKHRIRLEDLITREFRRVSAALIPPAGQPEPRGEQLLACCEGLCRMLLGMGAALARYDADEGYAHLITGAVEELGKLREDVALANELQRYPAVLLVYAVGVVAVSRSHFHYLAAAMLKPQLYGEPSRLTRVAHLDMASAVGTYNVLPKAYDRNAPASAYVRDALRNSVQEYMADNLDYARNFNIFEYLFALVHADSNERGPKGNFWAPHGPFAYQYPGLVGDGRPTPMDDFFERGLAQGDDWGLLRAGFFGGSAQRLNDVRAGYKAQVLDHLH